MGLSYLVFLFANNAITDVALEKHPCSILVDGVEMLMEFDDLDAFVEVDPSQIPSEGPARQLYNTIMRDRGVFYGFERTLMTGPMNA
ncbi:hypothetical protein [Neptuniibacter sp. QD37_11]|uniref:hypothetical protein n=1 Tax=Neptuniibacter sp. QD37_11 TaxID=3398209 RepID=UPI0039F62822